MADVFASMVRKAIRLYLLHVNNVPCRQVADLQWHNNGISRTTTCLCELDSSPGAGSRQNRR